MLYENIAKKRVIKVSFEVKKIDYKMAFFDFLFGISRGQTGQKKFFLRFFFHNLRVFSPILLGLSGYQILYVRVWLLSFRDRK